MARKASKRTPVKKTAYGAGNAAAVSAAEAAKTAPVAEEKETVVETVADVKEAVQAVEAVEKEKEAVTEEKAADEPKRKGRKPGSKNKVKTEKAVAEKTESVFVELDGNKFETDDIVARVRAAWVAEGHRAGNIKKLSVYINMNESRAYYVINDKAEGKYISLF